MHLKVVSFDKKFAIFCSNNFSTSEFFFFETLKLFFLNSVSVQFKWNVTPLIFAAYFASPMQIYPPFSY